MRVCVTTAYRENYGAHDWDGEGACPQYWKNKGSNERVVEVADAVFAAMSDSEVTAIMTALAAKATFANDYESESVIDTGLYPTGCHTPVESEFESYLANGITTEDERRFYLPKVILLAELGLSH